jgi:hypothetical protein
VGRRRGAAPALALLAALLAGCGGGSGQSDTLEPGPDLGVAVRLADCRDWREGEAVQRLGTIREIRSFAGGPVGPGLGHGATLGDEEAYELFERFCGNEFARAFKLYKLYTRAAGFGGLP